MNWYASRSTAIFNIRAAVLWLLMLFGLMHPVPAAAYPLPASQTSTAQNVASYSIDVTLDPVARRLSGVQTLTYRNTTQVPIPDLVFHLYLNAFRDRETLFMSESGGAGHGSAFDPQHNGWIEVDALRVRDGPPLRLERLADGTLARAVLPQPIPPGEQVALELAFTAQLPQVIARTGWAIDDQGDPFFMVGQWFPKLGVWTAEGWNAYPFHANNEFFANFGDYSVQITVPEGYKVAATGIETASPAAASRATFTFLAEDVIDFAWAASPNFLSATRTVLGTEMVYVYLPEHAWSVNPALTAAETAFTSFTDWFGPYPYPRLTILDVPEAGQAAGGMEYPMLFTAGAGPSPETGGFFGGGARGLEMLITHETGHQWWQSVVAFNEVEEPWLDEGLTDYATARLMLQQYGIDPASLEAGRYGNVYVDRRRASFLTNPDLPMYGRADALRGGNYVIAAYAKPALSLLTLEEVIGKDAMLETLSAFYERYRFNHPTTADLQVTAEAQTKQDLDWFFAGLVYGDDTLDYIARDISAATITLAVEGGLSIPVPVEVTFSDGSTETLLWDAQPAEEILRFANRPPLRSFIIDPQHTRFIELEWNNNHLERSVNPDPPARPPLQRVDARDVASYEIAVALDADARQLRGQETITYANTTDAPIPDLVFHLYLNAFASENTLFLSETRGLRALTTWDAQHPGWIEVEDLRLADGTTLALEKLADGTLARAVLPQPIPPGEQVALELAFTAQLPRVFARTGWVVDDQGDPFFMVGQWFPKLGVWTAEGWNAYPFHANNEFFANFGDYTVQITVPEGYKVAATGVETPSTGVETTSTGVETTSPASASRATFTFLAEDVIDFAWAASPNFLSATHTVLGTEMVYVYLPEHAWTVDRVLDAAETAFQRFSGWYGAYPYPRFTLVDVPKAGQAAGGMEYPMLVTVGTADVTGLGLDLLGQMGLMRGIELVTVHETGHQWWQSVVAFNEAEEPWLDEGLTDYSTVRALSSGDTRSVVNLGGFKLSYLDLRRSEFLLMPDIPMYGAAWELGQIEYGIAAYSKPALSLLTLQHVLGEETMNAVMGEFFRRYRFDHPTTANFRLTAEEVSGQNLDWFFEGLVYGEDTLNYSAQSIGEKSLTVTREGSLAIPTEILVTFADGSQQRLAWDGQPAEKTFAFDQALRSFVIDPERKLVVEQVWSDNGLARSPDFHAWLAAAARLLYRLQDWLLIMGGI